MTETREYDFDTPDAIKEVVDDVGEMVDGVTDDDQTGRLRVSVERFVWDEKECDVGREFVHVESKDRLESYPTGDGDWAVDLHHDYGCTRLDLCSDETHATAVLQSTIREDEPNRLL